MDTSERVLAGLSSPDWRERLRAIHALAELKDPQLIPPLVNVMVELAQHAQLGEEVADEEEVGEATERAIFAMNKDARLPLEKLRGDVTQDGLTRDFAGYLLSQLDWWQMLLKTNPGLR